MLYTRYLLARNYSAGKDLLEVGCGAGLGLAFLAQTATAVTGVDIDDANLSIARRRHGGNRKIRLMHGDAECLDAPENHYDTVLLYEAIYYLRSPQRFLAEARRVLRPGGTLIVCSVNKRWRGFNPSPHSVRYFDAGELRALIEQQGFQTRVFGGFVQSDRTLAASVKSGIRSIAVRMGLIPRTMNGKKWLKLMFYGPLTVLDTVEDGMAPAEPLIELQQADYAQQFKVLYAVSTLKKNAATTVAA